MGPFQSQWDQIVACWAKVQSTILLAQEDFLALSELWITNLVRCYIPNFELQIADALRLLYYIVKQLNRVIDNDLPKCSVFHCEELAIGHEPLEFNSRGVLLNCI